MNKYTSVSWVLAGVLLTGATQAAQNIKPSVPLHFVSPTDSVPFTAIYTITAPDTATSTGLGLRIHYDSSQFEPLDSLDSTAYTPGLQPLGDSSEDVDDLDNDPATDRFFVVAWLDFSAAWPGSGSLPLQLLETRFQVNSKFSGPTYIRTSASATAQNTAFQSTPMLVCSKPKIELAVLDDLALESGGDATARIAFQLDKALPVECGALEIAYQVTGTAQAGADYVALPASVFIPAGGQSIELVVTAVNDELVESDETLSVSLQAGKNYLLGSTQVGNISIRSEDKPKDNTSLPIDDTGTGSEENGKETVGNTNMQQWVQHKVPTVSEWVLLLMSALLGLLALSRIRFSPQGGQH